jgi:hypothetical protein
VRDAVAFETRGLPAVVVVLDVLSDIAQATAMSSGAKGLAIVALDAVLFGQSVRAVRRLSSDAAHQAVSALTEAVD